MNLLQERLARELTPINNALAAAADNLPSPCRPIAKHILESGGKRLRPLLLILFSQLLGSSREDIYALAASMEMLHAATLLHDDILDNAKTRRGKKAAHTIYGAPAAILAGDAMLAHGNALVAAFGNVDIVKCYSRATALTAAGEILEMNSLCDPAMSHDQYLEIAKNKTACLIAQTCRMGAFAADAPQYADTCEKFGENLGIAFQLVDDALDFAPEKQTGKPTGGDLREGKMTPPIRLYRNSLSQEDQKQFDAKFAAGSFSDEEETEIIRNITAFAEQAADLANSYLEEAKTALASLPDGTEKEVLRQMTEYVRNRRK